MKFQKKVQYDYELNGITEENGYTKWYNWEKVRKPVKIIGYILVATCFIAARVFKEELAVYGKLNQIIVAVCALLTLLIIVVPLHEILHLLAMSKGRLDDKCIITMGQGAVSAVYNGPLARSRQIISLLLPVTVLAIVFAAATILTSGVLRLYFIYLLIMSCLSSYTDIYMVFYTIKHIGKNDTIFGVYKKSE